MNEQKQTYTQRKLAELKEKLEIARKELSNNYKKEASGVASAIQMELQKRQSIEPQKQKNIDEALKHLDKCLEDLHNGS